MVVIILSMLICMRIVIIVHIVMCMLLTIMRSVLSIILNAARIPAARVADCCSLLVA